MLQGYKVSLGKFESFQSNSFGANPGNPYMVYKDPSSMIPILPVFGMDEGKAIVFIGCTPPEVEYFSWRSYAGIEGTHLVFASLGDSLNNLVIKTTGGDGDTHSRATAVVTAADHGVFDEVTAALNKSGFPASAVNLDAVAPDLLVDGMEATRFIMLHRASIWKNEEVKKAYFNQTQQILFIEKQKPFKKEPIAPLALRSRGTGHREQDIPGLEAAFKELQTKIISSYAELSYSYVGYQTTSGLPLDGNACLKNLTLNCKGDNHDTNYIILSNKTADPLHKNDLYVVVGVNQVKTNKATYTNIGLYKVPTIPYTTAVSTNLTIDSRKLNGSALVYFPDSEEEIASKLFAYAIARDCKDLVNCLEAGTEEIPDLNNWRLAYRTYLEKATKTGPKLSEIILPIVLRFRFSP